MVVQQERQINSGTVLETTIDPKIIAATSEQYQRQSFVRRGGFGRGRGKNGTRLGQGNTRKLCTYRGKTNHIVDTCYYKHGFPQGYKPNGAISTYAILSAPPLQISKQKKIGSTKQ